MESSFSWNTSTLLSTVLQILCFSQMERLWQHCTEQVYLLHFSNSSCSLGDSGSHFGHSRDISDFCITIILVMVSVISELWRYYYNWLKRLRGWWAFFRIKYEWRYVRCFWSQCCCAVNRPQSSGNIALIRTGKPESLRDLMYQRYSLYRAVWNRTRSISKVRL